MPNFKRVKKLFLTNKSQDRNKKIIININDRILAILFFASIGLPIWGVSIHRLTLIDIKYVVVTIFMGIVAGFVILTFLIKSSYSAFWTFFIKAGIGAGIFYFSLLF